jgi:MFS family permease
MGTVHNLTGLVIARVFLGMLEAGYFPGVAFYLSMWYKRSEHALRIAIFFSMATFAGAFGGLLAYGIGFMKNIGGYENGWHWIFILGKTSFILINCLEGLLTVVVSTIAPLFIRDVPPFKKILIDSTLTVLDF